MIRYRRNSVERDIAWLIIWVIFVAIVVLLTVDFGEGQWLIEGRKDDAQLCLTDYSADGAAGTRYGKCE